MRITNNRRYRTIRAAEDVATEDVSLLFEPEDVADLVSEVTGEDVDVAVEDDNVIFTVGEDEYTVSPEGDEEVLESSKKCNRKVKASTRMNPRSRMIRRSPVRGIRR